MAALAEAILLAVQAHHGQKQINGQPYILHPLALMMNVETEDEQMVAVLHDVVEDTAVSLDDLRQAGFAAHIIDAVDHLTRRDGETYEAFIQRIKPNALARRVKLADLHHNMDVLRLPEFSPSAVERLKRYRAAWDSLQSVEDGT